MQISTQHVGIYTDDIDESLKFYTDVLDFEVLFTSLADEAGIPLKMAWLRNSSGIVIELIEQENYQSTPAAKACRNHIALRVTNMDESISELKAKGVKLETEPFDPPLEFDRVLKNQDTFTFCGNKSVQLRVAFFRGPSGERFELMQDNLGSAQE